MLLDAPGCRGPVPTHSYRSAAKGRVKTLPHSVSRLAFRGCLAAALAAGAALPATAITYEAAMRLAPDISIELAGQIVRSRSCGDRCRLGGKERLQLDRRHAGGGDEAEAIRRWPGPEEATCCSEGDWLVAGPIREVEEIVSILGGVNVLGHGLPATSTSTI